MCEDLSNAKKLGCRKGMIKVLLALLMIRETKRLIVARFALRVLYRKQTIQAYNQYSSNAQVKLE